MKLWKICDYTGLWKEGVIEFSLTICIFLPGPIDPKMWLWNVFDCQVLNFNCRIRCFFFTALVSLAVNSMQFHTRVSFETYAFLFLRKFNITHDVDSEFAMAGSDIWCQPFSTGYFNLYRWQDRQNNLMAGQKNIFNMFTVRCVKSHKYFGPSCLK